MIFYHSLRGLKPTTKLFQKTVDQRHRGREAKARGRRAHGDRRGRRLQLAESVQQTG